MSVVLSDGLYRVARRVHPWPRDDHGTPVPPALGAYGTARAGAVNRVAGSASDVHLRLDPAEWPLRAGDKISDAHGAVYTVTGVPRFARNVAASDVDYVAVTATIDPPVVP